ncbi:hypothetical protein M422DRAFT_56637 [Sphaerobolus stellatus SS14]|uniref:Uncharacterized protein n=1 Tax=Sphaerobolus stellatus (strain SS14) TaxID=990650 RepID=A0A0C9U4B1_SPHS4|nr:hypothetical protein M422DRAFT_56637 [Sphaerobolus stellatus SS14]
MPPKGASPTLDTRTSKRARTINVKLTDPNNVDAARAPQSLLQKQTSTNRSSSSKKTGDPVISKKNRVASIPSSDSEIELRYTGATTSSKKDNDGLLKDLEGLEEIGELPAEGKTKDLDYFYGKSFKDDKGKSRRKCTVCKTLLVADVTTCRRHLQAAHKGDYLKWVKDTPGAINKLPEYLAEQRKKQDEKLQQSMVTDHFNKAEPKECIIPYSNELFQQAATEWLIATDQPSIPT